MSDDVQATDFARLTDAESETLAHAVVRQFIDQALNDRGGVGVYDRSRCDRVLAPVVARIIAARVAATRADERDLRDRLTTWLTEREAFSAAQDLSSAPPGWLAMADAHRSVNEQVRRLLDEPCKPPAATEAEIHAAQERGAQARASTATTIAGQEMTRG